MRKYNTVIMVLKKGGDYHFSDVEILCHHLKDKYKGDLPLRLICINDLFSKEQVLCGCLFLPMQDKWKGWWSKMNLFSPFLERFRPYLYLDLDTAVITDYAQLFPQEEQEDNLITLRDFYHLDKLASGVMWIPAENVKVTAIWNEWVKSPRKNQLAYRGDQEFMRGVIKKADLYFQDLHSLICSFKPKQGWLTILPVDKAIVCFHGQPRPSKAATTISWVSRYLNKQL